MQNSAPPRNKKGMEDRGGTMHRGEEVCRVFAAGYIVVRRGL